MEHLAAIDQQLIALIQTGLPIVPRPYQALAQNLGVTEEFLLSRLAALQADGTIKRFGVVVRHRQLGYRANAMIVLDVPDADIANVAHAIKQFPFITLCYRRPRCLPAWRYNLFCMIHGQDRPRVLAQLTQLRAACQLDAYPHEVLFSRQCFKQRGALYSRPASSSHQTQAA
ncbi:MAG: hypothetical protein RIS84_838 [Pseudomonadota bacterium]|jgi:DNA-binding Lrp family transcriptional regulator